MVEFAPLENLPGHKKECIVNEYGSLPVGSQNWML